MTSILILGRVPAIAQGLADELGRHGVRAVASTEVEQASALFDARDFSLIVFGSGAVGPATKRLREQFGGQNPSVRFLDAFAPVALRQILAALDPAEPQIADPRLVADAAGLRLTTTLRSERTLRVEAYRSPTDTGWDLDVVASGPAPRGPYTLPLDEAYRETAYMVVVSTGEEIHLLRLDALAA